MFKAILRKIAAECSKNLLDMDLWVAFVKSGYTMRGYIPNLRDVEMEKRFIRKPVKK